MFNPGLIDMIMRLRGRGISDNAVLRAMELVDRRHFIAQKYWDIAYDEQSLPISCGQTMSNPLTVGLMTQMLELSSEHKILEIGTGSGYHTAILSNITKRVYSVERYKVLISDAETGFAKIGVTNHVLRHGDGRYGWRGQAPFDRILIGCGVNKKPNKLMEQLGEGGVLVGVIGEKLMRYRKIRGLISDEVLFPLTLPMLETGKSKIL